MAYFYSQHVYSSIGHIALMGSSQKNEKNLMLSVSSRLGELFIILLILWTNLSGRRLPCEKEKKLMWMTHVAFLDLSPHFAILNGILFPRNVVGKNKVFIF